MNDIKLMDMTAEERIAGIAALELAGAVDLPVMSVGRTLSRSKRSLTIDQKIPSAAVVGNGIVSFVSGMSKQNKEDVKNSFLMSSLVANKKFDPNKEGASWFEAFTRTMELCGWLTISRSYGDYRAIDQHFTMEQVGLTILASAIAAAAIPGPTALLLAKVAKEAIEALQANDQPLRLFERKARTYAGGSFGVASCAESEDGEVIMGLGNVAFDSTVNVTDVLFWEWNSATVGITRGEGCLTLNQGVYDQIREAVLNRLGQNARDAIADFDI